MYIYQHRNTLVNWLFEMKDGNTVLQYRSNAIYRLYLHCTQTIAPNHPSWA